LSARLFAWNFPCACRYRGGRISLFGGQRMDGGQLIFHPIRVCAVVAVHRRRDQILRPPRGHRFLPASGKTTSAAVRAWLFRWVFGQSRNLGFLAAGVDDHVDAQRRRIFSACERSILDPHAGNLVQHFVAGANDCAVRFGYWRVFAAAAATALIIRLVGTQLSFPAFPGPYINPLKDSVLARIDDFVIGMVVAKLYRDRHLREASQWLFVPGVAVVVLSGIGWDLIAQGIAPRWVGGVLNLVTSTGFACVMMSCLAPGSGAGR